MVARPDRPGTPSEKFLRKPSRKGFAHVAHHMGLAVRGKGPGQGAGCPAKSAEPARNIEWQGLSVKIKPLKLLIFSRRNAWPGTCFQRLEPFSSTG
jgi:hypothetical protein